MLRLQLAYFVFPLQTLQQAHPHYILAIQDLLNPGQIR